MKLKIVPTWLLFVFSENMYLTFSLSLRLVDVVVVVVVTLGEHNDSLTVSTRRVAIEKWTRAKAANEKNPYTIYMGNRRIAIAVLCCAVSNSISFCNVYYYYCYPCGAYLAAVNVKRQKHSEMSNRLPSSMFHFYSLCKWHGHGRLQMCQCRKILNSLAHTSSLFVVRFWIYA